MILYEASHNSKFVHAQEYAWVMNTTMMANKRDMCDTPLMKIMSLVAHMDGRHNMTYMQIIRCSF